MLRRWVPPGSTPTSGFGWVAWKSTAPVSVRLAGTDGMPEFRLSLMAEGATSPAEEPASVR